MKVRVLLILAVSTLACERKPAPHAAAAPPHESSPRTVTVDPATRRQLNLEVRRIDETVSVAPIEATGQLQLNEDHTWRVGAVTEGRIVSVPVRLGDVVKAGQIVAEMHSHAVHDARADRRQAMADLERLKVLAEQARRVRDRTQRLYALKAASREQVEAAETQYRAAEFDVTNAQVEVQKADTHLTDFLEVPLQENAPSAASDTEDRIPIKAPAAGTVMERLANAGTVVPVAAPVVTISDLSSLWLIAAVNEADLSQIRRGQTAKVLVRAYPERPFKGSVFQLGERLDPQTRTLQVRVLVANPAGLLKPDMFATVEFEPRTQRKALHVPESALQEINGRLVVFLQNAAGSFAPRPVQTGARTAGQVEVTSGIQPGDSVVVNGALLLKGELLKSEAGH